MTTLPQTTNIRLPRPMQGGMQLAQGGHGGALGAPNPQGSNDVWRVIRANLWWMLIVVCVLAPVTGFGVNEVLKRRFPVLSLGFVAARIMESAFIAIGIISVLALVTLRATAGDADPAALTVVGQALVAIHDWTFKMGPGVVVGVGNGLILGYMMWKTRLLPRFLSILGLLGGPALLLGEAVRVGARQGEHERRLPMVDVAGGGDDAHAVTPASRTSSSDRRRDGQGPRTRSLGDRSATHRSPARWRC